MKSTSSKSANPLESVTTLPTGQKTDVLTGTPKSSSDLRCVYQIIRLHVRDSHSMIRPLYIANSGKNRRLEGFRNTVELEESLCQRLGADQALALLRRQHLE